LTAKAAEYLGVAQNTLRKWAERGEIPMHRKPIYLGYTKAAARTKADRLIGEWLANGRHAVTPASDCDLTIADWSTSTVSMRRPTTVGPTARRPASRIVARADSAGERDWRSRRALR
jgi:hypothetical protein